MSLTRNRRRPPASPAPQETRAREPVAAPALSAPVHVRQERVRPAPRPFAHPAPERQVAERPAQVPARTVQVQVRPVTRSARAALLQSPAVSVAAPAPAPRVTTSRAAPTSRHTPERGNSAPRRDSRAHDSDDRVFEPGNSIHVTPKSPVARSTPHWKQAERWFWLTHPETMERELVKPAGTTHVQGPFEMVQFTTQGGSLKTCSVLFFETNTQPWNPGSGMR